MSKKILALLVFSAFLSLFIAQGMVFAQEGPPVLENPFGDPVEEVDDTPPSLTLPTPPTPTPPIDYIMPSPDDPIHQAPPELTQSGPQSLYLLILLAASLGGGYLYTLAKQKN